MNKKTVTDAILRVLKRGPKKGLAAETIADRAGVKLSTTRTVLASLKKEGSVAVIGTENRGFGRPANLYVQA